MKPSFAGAVVGVLLGYCLLALIGCGSPTAPSTGNKTTQVTASVTPTPTVPTTVTGVAGAWSETFGGSLSSRWAVSNYTNQGGTIFDPAMVDLNGALNLHMQQDRTADGGATIARGSEVYTVEKYGFGTYAWVVQWSHSAYGAGNGEVGGAFIWSPTTEIDFEQEGGAPSVVHGVYYHNGHNNGVQDAGLGDTAWSAFHEYRFVWTPTSITWFVDGQQVNMQTRDVPQDPASVLMNHTAVGHGVWGLSTTRCHDDAEHSFIQLCSEGIMKGLFLALVFAALCAACGGNTSTGPSGQQLTYATLTVDVDAATCAPFAGRVLEVYIDGVAVGTIGVGVPFNKSVEIGTHYVTLGNGSASLSPSTVQVPVGGFHLLYRC